VREILGARRRAEDLGEVGLQEGELDIGGAKLLGRLDQLDVLAQKRVDEFA